MNLESINEQQAVEVGNMWRRRAGKLYEKFIFDGNTSVFNAERAKELGLELEYRALMLEFFSFTGYHKYNWRK